MSDLISGTSIWGVKSVSLLYQCCVCAISGHPKLKYLSLGLNDTLAKNNENLHMMTLTKSVVVVKVQVHSMFHTVNSLLHKDELRIPIKGDILWYSKFFKYLNDIFDQVHTVAHLIYVLWILLLQWPLTVIDSHKEKVTLFLWSCLYHVEEFSFLTKFDNMQVLCADWWKGDSVISGGADSKLFISSEISIQWGNTVGFSVSFFSLFLIMWKEWVTYVCSASLNFAFLCFVMSYF